MKRDSKLLRPLEQGPCHKRQFNVIPKTHFFVRWSYPLCRVYSQHILSPTDWMMTHFFSMKLVFKQVKENFVLTYTISELIWRQKSGYLAINKHKILLSLSNLVIASLFSFFFFVFVYFIIFFNRMLYLPIPIVCRLFLPISNRQKIQFRPRLLSL